MIETGRSIEKVLLIGVDSGQYDAEASMEELSELTKTAGAEVAGQFLQKLSSVNNITYIGSGKLHEVKEFCERHEVTLLIADDELSGAQLRNIEEETGVRVIDRTMLILDIFASRAQSREGKLQVELAQQKYLMPRLIGIGRQLSRQGGGIGTRGPGESKLESDRRHIRRRIQVLERQLAELSAQRARTRERRNKNECPSIALVGYTNVGKSTLLNRLTHADVLEKDQLFATLDPTARSIRLPSGKKAILVDTVGFLSRLPHQLIEAFRSTLEEASNADVILNLCDISNSSVDSQLEVSRQLLQELGCGGIPTVTVYNKADRLEQVPKTPQNNDAVFVSARTGMGIERLLTVIDICLSKGMDDKLKIPNI